MPKSAMKKKPTTKLPAITNATRKVKPTKARASLVAKKPTCKAAKRK